MALAPLAFMDLRAPYDSTVAASDASESGGGLSFSSGLTNFGVEAERKCVRGLERQVVDSDDRQVFVISLFDGIGTCRVALDVLGAKVAGYVSVESDGSARRVVESAFSSTEFIHAVEDISDAVVLGWACKFSRSSCVLLAANLPQPGFSELKSPGVESLRNRLHQEVLRVRELIEKHFSWAETFLFVEGASSMSCLDRSSMTKSVGILPYELDAVGITPCRRSRVFWFDWAVTAEEGVEIERPSTSKSEDCGRVQFLLDCPPKPYLTPGWTLAGGDMQKLPTFTTSNPKAQPGLQPSGIESCTARDLSCWQSDRFRFAPYQYRFQHGVIHPKQGWRIPNVNEREALLGFPLEYTRPSWSKTHRKQDPTGWEDCRLSLLGCPGSVPVIAFLLKHLLAVRHL